MLNKIYMVPLVGGLLSADQSLVKGLIIFRQSFYSDRRYLRIYIQRSKALENWKDEIEGPRVHME